MPTPRTSERPWAYLGLDVGVVVVLEQQRGRLGVVLSGGDVQSRQAHLALSVILQQDRDHLVVALLQGDGQGGEAILGEGTIRDQKYLVSRTLNLFSKVSKVLSLNV